jgi:PKD domain/Bacterial Ig domain
MGRTLARLQLGRDPFGAKEIAMMIRSNMRRLNRMVSALSLALAALLLAVSPLAAQNPPPKDEIFGGYSVLFPNGWEELNYKANTIPNAFDVSNTYYFCRFCNLGWLIDGSGHYKGGTTPPNLENGASDTTGVGYALSGLQYKWHNEKWSPFVRGLLGAANISPDCCHGTEWDFAAGGGGGLDLVLSRRISFRLIQADYIYSNYSHKIQATQISLQSNPITHPTQWNSIRLATGIVFNIGSYNPAPKSCVVTASSPTEVWAGEPVKFSALGSNFNPKHTVAYSWKSAGGKLASANTSATEIDTTGLAPGTYNVTATLTDPKMKSNNSASCPASFIVKAPPPPIPPTVQCVPSETTIKPGESATVRMVATNPDKRPLTYAWTTTSGQVSGSGNSATVTPSNNDAGSTITITGTVNDDRNLSATCRVTVIVPKLPPPCVVPVSWGECLFKLNPSLPARVDNSCKDVLDKLALDIQGRPTGKLVIVGSAAAANAAKNPNLAAQRAENAKHYLTTGGSTKVDADRIETRQGGADENVVRFFFIPAGDLCAGHPELGSPVDESAVKGQQRGKLPHKKKAAPPAQ